MTSQKQIEANRRNALRSTGPRTTAGKARSRRNAFKHGLSIPLDSDGAIAQSIDALATEFASISEKPYDIARAGAKEQLQVERIQRTRAEIINRSATRDAGTADDVLDDESRSGAAIAAALPDLVRLDRYERRALSRLKKILSASKFD